MTSERVILSSKKKGNSEWGYKKKNNLALVNRSSDLAILCLTHIIACVCTLSYISTCRMSVVCHYGHLSQSQVAVAPPLILATSWLVTLATWPWFISSAWLCDLTENSQSVGYHLGLKLVPAAFFFWHPDLRVGPGSSDLLLLIITLTFGAPVTASIHNGNIL